MGILTLTTDFGLQDGFIGMMKGVILGICPQTQIVDISHDIRPQQVAEGAFVLARAVPYFPPKTVHVAVIDPGVGTGRGAIAAHIGDAFFVAPDNGLLWPLMQKAQQQGERVEVVRLENPAYWRQHVSRTFHGRDVFSPVGAHLACGVALADLGPAVQVQSLVSLPRQQPRRVAQGWEAHIQYIDRFGNLFTNLPAESLPKALGTVRLKVKDAIIKGVHPSYGHRPPGSLVAVINSENWLEIAQVNGNAAAALGAHVGDSVFVEFS